MNEQELLHFNQENVYCGQSPRGYGLTHFAKKDFKCNAVIMKGFGKLVRHQTSHFSIQIGLNQHFIPHRWSGKYWNHSCEPNTFIRTRSDGFPNLIAQREIKAHEEINYAYYMTEYEWSEKAEENSIMCQCGAQHCTGKILSFSQLSFQEQLTLKMDRRISHYLGELLRTKYFPSDDDLSSQVKEISPYLKEIVVKKSHFVILNNPSITKV